MALTVHWVAWQKSEPKVAPTNCGLKCQNLFGISQRKITGTVSVRVNEDFGVSRTDKDVQSPTVFLGLRKLKSSRSDFIIIRGMATECIPLLKASPQSPGLLEEGPATQPKSCTINLPSRLCQRHLWPFARLAVLQERGNELNFGKFLDNNSELTLNPGHPKHHSGILVSVKACGNQKIKGVWLRFTSHWVFKPQTHSSYFLSLGIRYWNTYTQQLTEFLPDLWSQSYYGRENRVKVTTTASIYYNVKPKAIPISRGTRQVNTTPNT